MLAVVIAVVVIIVAKNNSGPSYKADADLEKLLLTSDEAVTPAAGVDDWNANQINELLDTCGNTTFSEDGASGSITFSKLSGIDGDGFALRMTVEAEGTEITLGVAVTRVGKHVVIFTGGTAGQFDETEFVQLATAANDKVNAEL